MDLTVVPEPPPVTDSDLFETDKGQAKRPASEKQREHLKRAREKAREAAARRRKLEEEAKAEVKREKEKEIDPKEIDQAEPEPYNSEDEQVAEFETFLRQMKRYKEMKIAHRPPTPAPEPEEPEPEATPEPAPTEPLRVSLRHYTQTRRGVRCR